MSVKDLAAALRNGGSVALEGDYVLSAALTVTKAIAITGTAKITFGFSSSGFPLIFSCPSMSAKGSFSFDMGSKVAGIKILSPIVDTDGLNVKNVKPGLHVNAVEVVGATTHCNLKNSDFDNVDGSGFFVTSSNHVRVNDIRGHNVCKKYPAGGVVCVDDSCTDVVVDGITGSGVTQNDIVYVGTSRKFIPGVIVRNVKGTLTNDPAAGPGLQACGVKMYGDHGFLENVDVTWLTPNGYGISDWGSEDTIRNIKVRGGSHGVGLFGSSTIPLTGMDIVSAKNYDNNGKYTISSTPPPPPTNYTLTILHPTGSGVTIPATGSYQNNSGPTLSLTATPQDGWHFDHWLIDGVMVILNPAPLSTGANHSASAVFLESVTPPSDPCADIKKQLETAGATIIELNAKITTLTSQNNTLETNNHSLLITVNAQREQLNLLKADAEKLLADAR